MFDTAKFEKTRFSRRKKILTVETTPDLKVLQPFFGKEAPAWTLQSLNGEDLSQVNQSADQMKHINQIIDALANEEIKKVILELLGAGDSVPGDLAKRITALMLGSVEPTLTRQQAVKLFEQYPVQAFFLANTVFELTGLGAEPGK